ncbi:MAG: acetyl-CoA C-acetyltransferase [Spirochaeta sp.]|jgi:acetyl-CoA C-acetyltransferase|nr:acetyl-CoA C-acetyltransferase [Spirochaeta sp.]
MKEVYICAARRTAIGTFGGSFTDTPATELGAIAVKAALAQAGLDPEAVDELILGIILSAGVGMGPARQVSIGAGIPADKPAYATNMLCGSGMKAIMQGVDRIRLGRSEVVVAAGTENMSQAPYLAPYKMRFGARMGSLELTDHMIRDGLTDVFHNYHMGVTAENIAQKHAISREAQDTLAAESQHKAGAAIEAGRFAEEIAPVTVRQRKTEVEIVTDEHPRPEATAAGLARLRPAFAKEGTVTAGNASGINDGASAVVLASQEAVTRHGLTPLARIVADGQAGVDPAYMGLGPVPAIRGALADAGMKLSHMELIELNEAFAAQSLGVITELAEEHDLDETVIMERCNVNGGAIALGHPVGASGNRITVTLLHEMIRRGARYGLASLCIGGGMGTALVIERL